MSVSLTPDHGAGEKSLILGTEKDNPNNDANGSELEEVHAFVHASRFHGQSSGSALLSDALKLTLCSDVDETAAYKDIMSRHIAHAHAYYLERALNLFFQGPIPEFKFPPEDLMDSLISLYFDKLHWIFPVLHIPTFHSHYRCKLHIRNHRFAIILLLVCAVGSRYSSDPRVLPTCAELEKESEEERWLQAGLDYYAQVFPYLGRSPVYAPSLFDLQKLALACLYVQDSKNNPQGWSWCGLGIRIASEAGAHRKKNDAALTTESQLWSRAFWALVAIDRLTSAVTGRPWAIQDEDIDLDFPLGVDDEYWETPDPAAWKQPSDKPALTDYTRSSLKLLEILAFTLRSAYSTPKSRLMQGLAVADWQQRVVLEIDSALNKWFDSIPEHLRWNPQQENKILLNQSALLHCLYYHVQTLAHRPFISTKNSSLSFVSLTICTNAARSSSHILEAHRTRGDPLSHMIPFAFTSGVVLLLNIWGAKKLGIRADPERHMQDVFKWAKAEMAWWVRLLLESLELHDGLPLSRSILNELISAGKLPHPTFDPLHDVPVGTKRSRSSQSGTETTSVFSGQTGSPDHEEVPNAPSSNVAQYAHWNDLASFDESQTRGQHSVNDQGVQSHHPKYHQTGKCFDRSTSSAGSQAAVSLADSTIGKVGLDDMPIWSEDQQYASISESLLGSSSFSAVQPLSTFPQGHTSNSASQTSSVYPQEFLDLDMLDIWATVPTSFEAQDWGDFAQEFQLEEQLRASGL
ncbi:fungal-specific transcription factor domain-containing protein [Gautieria morchelliformis]|nr:fungal-specific transcription factor domain-containing protein [Gautieria morchelliformis]